jgi:hypothetical protein
MAGGDVPLENLNLMTANPSEVARYLRLLAGRLARRLATACRVAAVLAVSPASVTPAADGKPLVRLQVAQLGTTLASMPQAGTRNAVEVLKDLKEIKPEVKFDPQTWLDLGFL